MILLTEYPEVLVSWEMIKFFFKGVFLYWLFSNETQMQDCLSYKSGLNHSFQHHTVQNGLHLSHFQMTELHILFCYCHQPQQMS